MRVCLNTLNQNKLPHCYSGQIVFKDVFTALCNWIVFLEELDGWGRSSCPPSVLLCFWSSNFWCQGLQGCEGCSFLHGRKKGMRILLKLVRIDCLFRSCCKIHITLSYLSGFPVLSVRGESCFQVITVYGRCMIQVGSGLFRDVSHL